MRLHGLVEQTAISLQNTERELVETISDQERSFDILDLYPKFATKLGQSKKLFFAIPTVH